MNHQGMLRNVLFIMLVLTILVPGVAALNNRIYYSTPGNAVIGDCSAFASITAKVYNASHINEPAFLQDTTLMTADANGLFTGITGNLDATVPGKNYDINFTVENPSCSAGAFGTLAEFTVFLIQSGPDLPAEVTVTLDMTAPFTPLTPSNASTTNDNTTTFTWADDYTATDVYNLQISSGPTFASLVLNQSGIMASTYTLTSGQQLDDGEYYYRIRAINATNDVFDTTYWHVFSVYAHEAIISSPSPANNSWTALSSLPMSIQTNVASDCSYGTSPGTAFGSKTPFSTTGGTTHSTTVPVSSEGSNTIYVQCNTTNGIVNANDYGYVIRRDTTAPSASGASVLIEGGSAYSLDTTLDFTWSGFSDGAGSGIATYYYSRTNNQGTTTGTADTSSPGQITSAAQGSNTVYVWAADTLGNIGLAASDTIVVDSVAPSFPSWTYTPTDLTKYYSGSFRVDFTVSDTSSLNGRPMYRYRIGSDSWSGWTVASIISAPNYYFIITEQGSPDTWFERNGEFLYFQVNATDARGWSNNVTRSEFINNESQPPVLAAISNKNAYQDSRLTFALLATDPDYSTLTYSCNISGATVTKVNDSYANVTWTPGNGDVGINHFRCNVTDGIFMTHDNFTITVQNVNDPPVLGEIGSLYAQEYVYFNYTANATDEDDDLLIFTSNSTIFSLNRISGKISFTPFSSHRGVHRFNISVYDGIDGYDFEAITFTVGYCGDGTCASGFELCSSCEADCGICDLEDSKTIIVESRNCLNEEMSVQAVSLVKRATCSVKGIIIDDMEVCEAQDDQTLTVLFGVDDTWEEVTSLVTDEEGFASYKPTQEGQYKVQYSSDTAIYTLFESKECLGDDEKDSSPSSPKPASKPSEAQKPPVLEEPSIVEESAGRWSLYALMLYFVFIPLLFIVLIISGMAYWYGLEKKKEKSSFVTVIDRHRNILRQKKLMVLTWMKRTPPLNYMVDGWMLVKSRTGDGYVRFAKMLSVQLSSLFLVLGLKRTVKLPFYDIAIPKEKRIHLLLVSLLKFCQPKRSVDELLTFSLQYSLGSLIDVAALLVSQGVRVKMIDPSPAAYMQVLLNKGVQFRRKLITRIDMESSLREGWPLICTIACKESHGWVARPVLVYATDKAGFYYHDVIGGKGGLGLKKDEFMHRYSASGGRAVLIEGVQKS